MVRFLMDLAAGDAAATARLKVVKMRLFADDGRLGEANAAGAMPPGEGAPAPQAAPAPPGPAGASSGGGGARTGASSSGGGGGAGGGAAGSGGNGAGLAADAKRAAAQAAAEPVEATPAAGGAAAPAPARACALSGMAKGAGVKLLSCDACRHAPSGKTFYCSVGACAGLAYAWLPCACLRLAGPAGWRLAALCLLAPGWAALAGAWLRCACLRLAGPRWRAPGCAALARAWLFCARHAWLRWAAVAFA